jgi:CHAD domain-containing protein
VVYIGWPRSLARELEQRFGALALESAPPRIERRIELDTIELGLERAGGRLTWEPSPSGGGVLAWLGPDGRQAQAELEAPPEFALDLEPGPLRIALDKAAGLRRLLALREVERSERELRRVDERGKTVARIMQRRERFRPPGSSSQWSDARAELVALPVRGFEPQHEELVAALAGLRGLRREDGAARAPRPAPGLPFLFEPLDAWPALERSEPAARALRAIVLRQLEIVQAQERGLRADLDTEFHHDLRVAVRRARAMLSQLGGALESGEAQFLRQQLAWLGQLTGPLRDLDVLLLELRQLEAELREPLQPLSELLEERRASEREALIEALDAPRWVEVQALWQAWAESPSISELPTLGELLAERIERLRRRVQREGARLGPQAAPSALHGLRIECKKLRYLLDCAARSAGSAASAQCVGVLRGLQEVLGVVNDARLQAERLEGWSRLLARRDPHALLALGRWIERRLAVERRARARFAERFEGFGARGARKGFEGLCDALRAGARAP